MAEMTNHGPMTGSRSLRDFVIAKSAGTIELSESQLDAVVGALAMMIPAVQKASLEQCAVRTAG